MHPQQRHRFGETAQIDKPQAEAEDHRPGDRPEDNGGEAENGEKEPSGEVMEQLSQGGFEGIEPMAHSFSGGKGLIVAIVDDGARGGDRYAIAHCSLLAKMGASVA